MCCILSQPKVVCASGRYNESQTTVSGSPTSLVLPLPHQSEVAYRLNLDMEEKLLPCLPAARCQGTTAVPRQRAEGLVALNSYESLSIQ